jgi:hypothetical protein
MRILNNRHEFGPMHNTMELLKPINKTKFLTPYEQLYIQSHHHHKQLIPDSGVPRGGFGGFKSPPPRNSEAGPNSEIRGK